MEYANLGRAGVKISRVGMGCLTFGREIEEAESRRMVDLAFDYGINFFDTANSYAQGRSEEILGRALQGRRNQVVLATKVFNPMGEGPNDRGSSRYNILRAVDESLRRLKTDRIDLYQLHRFDPEVPLDETLRALDDLIRWGKVIYIGCSNFTGPQLKESLTVMKERRIRFFSSVQPMYNLLKREAEAELFPLCIKEGIGVIPYNPLAGGFLLGKYLPDAPPSTGTRLGDLESYRKRYLSDENFKRTTRFLEAANKRGVHPISLSIAWVASHPAVTSPILGARNEEQLKETLKLITPKLSIEERDRLTKEVWDESSKNEKV